MIIIIVVVVIIIIIIIVIIIINICGLISICDSVIAVNQLRVDRLSQLAYPITRIITPDTKQLHCSRIFLLTCHSRLRFLAVIFSAFWRGMRFRIDQEY